MKPGSSVSNRSAKRITTAISSDEDPRHFGVQFSGKVSSGFVRLCFAWSLAMVAIVSGVVLAFAGNEIVGTAVGAGGVAPLIASFLRRNTAG